MNFIIRTRFLSLVPEKENEMKKYILKRLLQLIPILLVITFLSWHDASGRKRRSIAENGKYGNDSFSGGHGQSAGGTGAG